jgi:hypothetical protein
MRVRWTSSVVGDAKTRFRLSGVRRVSQSAEWPARQAARVLCSAQAGARA